MDGILAGVVLLALGALICFAGLRVFIIALPIWGFLAGFYVGAAAVQSIFGGGFLSTLTSWIGGVVIGLLAAAVSYLVWYVGVIIAAASVGALLGSGLLAALGVQAEWLVIMVSLVFAVVAAIASVILAAPVYVVMVSTAAAGAAALIAGVLLMVNTIDLAELERGATWAIISASWWWLLIWVVLAVTGLVAQWRLTVEPRFPSDRWRPVSYA